MHVCMYVFMTKVISISDDAYENLRKLKKEQSFSEIIIELSMEKGRDNLMKFAGVLANEEAEKIKKEIYKERKITSRRFR